MYGESSESTEREDVVAAEKASLRLKDWNEVDGEK